MNPKLAPPPSCSPCPFCGGKPEVWRQETARVSQVIYCKDCGCRHECGDIWGKGTLQWNFRANGSDQPTAEKSTEKLKEEKLKEESINVLGCTPEEITPKAWLVKDFGADSWDCMEIILGIEASIGKEIPDSVFDGTQDITFWELVEDQQTAMIKQTGRPNKKSSYS